MTRIQVEVVSARNLANKDGLFGKNDPYVTLKVGWTQKHKTKTHKNAGSACDFNETFQFDVKDGDDLQVQIFDDDLLKDDKIGSCKIPLRSVFQSGYVESWYQIGEGAKNCGEVLLRIRAL